MRRAYYDKRPSALEAVGNGDYLYRWDVKEESAPSMETGGEARVQYSCMEITTKGDPDYGKLVTGVIRSSYSADEEMAMVNKYNAYQRGVITDSSIEDEYQAFLVFVKKVKEMVREDLGID